MLNSKFWQGFFAIAPMISFILIFIGYFVFLFSLFSNMPEMEQGEVPPMEFFGGFVFFFIMIFITIIINLGSLIFYIIHAVQNPNLKENNLLIVWILLFVFVSGIGQLIYWILEIISKRKNIDT